MFDNKKYSNMTFAESRFSYNTFISAYLCKDNCFFKFTIPSLKLSDMIQFPTFQQIFKKRLSHIT